MNYYLEDQETNIYYEPINKKWIYETNYAPHIKKLLHFKKHIVATEKGTDGRITYVRLAFANNEFIINPFPKEHRQYSEKQKVKMRQQLAKNVKGVQSNETPNS